MAMTKINGIKSKAKRTIMQIISLKVLGVGGMLLVYPYKSSAKEMVGRKTSNVNTKVLMAIFL